MFRFAKPHPRILYCHGNSNCNDNTAQVCSSYVESYQIHMLVLRVWVAVGFE